MLVGRGVAWLCGRFKPLGARSSTASLRPRLAVSFVRFERCCSLARGQARHAGRPTPEEVRLTAARAVAVQPMGLLSFVFCGLREPGSSPFLPGRTSRGWPQPSPTEPGSRYPAGREGHRLRRKVALPFRPKDPAQVTYEYRVFIVHDGEESTFSHFSSEKLWEGAVLRVSKPGAAFDGLSVTVHRVVSHPTNHGPGIAYGRGSDG